MFLVCPRCLHAQCRPQILTNFACPYCRHSWNPPLPRFAYAYNAEFGELEFSLVSDRAGKLLLTTFPTIIGRDSDFAELQNNLAVSRQHCEILFDSSRQFFTIRDLGSRGGTHCPTGPVLQDQIGELRPSETLRVSGFALRLEAKLKTALLNSQTHRNPGRAPLALPPQVPYFLLALDEEGNPGVYPLATAPANPIALLCRITENNWLLVVLKRELVRLNGDIVVEQRLQPMDQITFAGQGFTYLPSEQVFRPETIDLGPSVLVQGLSLKIGSHRILKEIDCHLPASRLTALVGRSGSGKSTLLRILAGIAVSDSGSIRIDGMEMTSSQYTAWTRDHLALVPQNDIIHDELTIEECMRFSADLRLGPFVSFSEKSARIDRVLHELELSAHVHKRIGQLSGGQRKRVNVAVELIRSPHLLLLDEPTTGLDYHTEQGLISTLRRLSRQGRTVVFVTHSLSTLPLVDHVILLQNDGTGASVKIEGAAEFVQPQLQGPNISQPESTSLITESTHAGILSRAPQLITLTRRYTRQWLSSPVSTTLSLLILPFILGVLVRLAVSSDGRLGTDRMLFGLIAAFWLGMNQSVREIVREKDIFLREHSVRVGSMSVLLSKLAFFAIVALLQATLLSGPLKYLEVDRWTVQLADDELICPWSLLIAMFWLADFVGCVIGLLISACCLYVPRKGEVVAVLMVILVTLPQILFSAKMIPEGLARDRIHYHSFTLWHETTPLPEVCSYLTVTRYLFLPLDAVSRGVGHSGPIFAFNLTILAMTMGILIVVAWVVMETFVVWRKRINAG